MSMSPAGLDGHRSNVASFREAVLPDSKHCCQICGSSAVRFKSTMLPDSKEQIRSTLLTLMSPEGLDRHMMRVAFLFQQCCQIPRTSAARFREPVLPDLMQCWQIPQSSTVTLSRGVGVAKNMG